MKNRNLFPVLLVVVVIAFSAGIINLFHMRFKSGDIYPAYSSLRSDPLGTKILFEGLRSIQRVSADRNYTPLHNMRAFPDASYFILGMKKNAFNNIREKEIESLESAIHDGGQLVVTFWPEKKPRFKLDIRKRRPFANTPPDDQKSDSETGKSSEEGSEERNACDISGKEIADKWGVSFAYLDMPQAGDSNMNTAASLTDSRYDLPDTISWHSGIYFNISASEWDVIYTVDDYPVIIERNMGRGRIILSSDTYVVSNEAMLRERHPGLLAWLTGDNRRIIFDETHFGIIARPNIMTLARTYRLHGIIASLLVLAGLYIWKNSSSLLPPDEHDSREPDTQNIRDYVSGLVNLLRRNIPDSDILRVCVQEWKKSITRTQHTGDDITQIGSIVAAVERLPRKQRRAAAAYETIRHILTKRRYI
jgi:hypothetical protein